MLFIIVPILSAALLGLNLLLAPSIPDEAKLSAYECGFNMLPGQTISTFQILRSFFSAPHRAPLPPYI